MEIILCTNLFDSRTEAIFNISWDGSVEQNILCHFL